MVNLFCLVLGHKRTLLAFSSQRFYCVRCGMDLGVVIPAPKTPEARPATTLQKRSPGRRVSRDARSESPFP
jgi:hypothetical protein